MDSLLAVPHLDPLGMGVARRRLSVRVLELRTRSRVRRDLNLTGVFIVPLIALVLVRFVRDELSRRGLAVRMGIMLAVEFWISTEVVVTLTIMLIAGLVLAIVLLAEARRRVAASIAPIAGAYAGAAVLAAPLLFYVWKGPRPGPFANQFWTAICSTSSCRLGSIELAAARWQA